MILFFFFFTECYYCCQDFVHTFLVINMVVRELIITCNFLLCIAPLFSFDFIDQHPSIPFQFSACYLGIHDIIFIFYNILAWKFQKFYHCGDPRWNLTIKNWRKFHVSLAFTFSSFFKQLSIIMVILVFHRLVISLFSISLQEAVSFFVPFSNDYC